MILALWLFSPLLQNQVLNNRLLLLLMLPVLVICLMALMVLMIALLPKAGTRSRQMLLRSPRRSFFVGLVNYVFLLGLVAVMGESGVEVLGLVAALILAGLAIVTALGLSGLVMLTGERLAAMQTQEMSPLRQVIWGALTLEFATLLPIVGWFLVAPAALMISFGAAVLAWRNRKVFDPEMMAQ